MCDCDKCVNHLLKSFGGLYFCSRTIYVGGLPDHTTEQGVRAAFSKYGDAVAVRLVRERSSNAFRGFCFVEFHTEAAATGAIAEDRQLVLGRNVRGIPAKSVITKSGCL